jgi:hypothetical protein
MLPLWRRALNFRRFIDPEARFKFVPGKGYRPQEGELRFDMFEAERRLCRLRQCAA